MTTSQNSSVTTVMPDHEDPEGQMERETLNIIVAVSISVTLTLLLLIILTLIILYRKRSSCLLCSSTTKSGKASMGSVDEINISTIGRYYDILKSPMRKFSLSVLSDRKSSNASRKLSVSSQVQESCEHPRSCHSHYLNSHNQHLCPPSQNFTSRSIGEEEINHSIDDDGRMTKRLGDCMVIPHIALESESNSHFPRLDQLRLISHSAPIPRHQQQKIDLDDDDDSMGSPFSRTPRLDDREAIFGKPEINNFKLEEEISKMKDIDESSEDMIDDSSYSEMTRKYHFGQSLSTLSPLSSPPIKNTDRNSYNPQNETFDLGKESTSLNYSHQQFRSEGWLIESPSVPPKIAPRLPPKQAINKSKNEIQTISKELKDSSLALKSINNSEYEDYDNPPDLSNEFEDYDIPAARGVTEE